jgi:hypothetical protein
MTTILCEQQLHIFQDLLIYHTQFQDLWVNGTGIASASSWHVQYLLLLIAAIDVW